MRYATILALTMITVLVLSGVARAQDITFNGNDIILLAKTITAQVSKTNVLPPSFQMTMANGHQMIVTAPSVFELLARATVAWKENKAFPTQVPLMILDLNGPAFDPQHEPKRPGQVIAVPSVDIGNYAPLWLQMAEAPGHKLPYGMKFETSYRLTMAQIIVAMAALIEETLRENKFPSAVAIPLIKSPTDWLDTRAPIALITPPTKDDNQIWAADMRITLNGIELSDRGPSQHIAPFCGTVRVEMLGYGPVAAIRLQLDGVELRTFKGVGVHTYELETLPLLDGQHTLAATASDQTGKTYAFVFGFSVLNGRINGFTPAELEDLGN